MHEFSEVSSATPRPSSIDGKYYTNYVTENLINGKFYYGAHETFNLRDSYHGSGMALDLAINKYGIDNFKTTIVWFGETQDEMYDLEALVVDKDFIKRKDVYNLVVGERRGNPYVPRTKIVSEETRRKRSLSLMGKTRTEKQKIKFKNINLGRVHSEKSRRNMSIAKRKLCKHLTEEQKEHLRIINIGRKHSEETILKISLAKKGKSNHRKGKKHSEETKEKIRLTNIKTWNEKKKNMDLDTSKASPSELAESVEAFLLEKNDK